MSISLRCVACLAVFATLVPGGLSAQPHDLRVQHLMAADGLPTNFVKYIIQDHLGFLWIATESGLVRYDGYTFTHYFPKAGDSTSIGGSDLWTLFEDASGDIWIGAGGGGGLSRFDRETEHFIRYRHDPADPTSLSQDEVRGIYESPNEPGVLWIGTENGGLNRLEVKSGAFTRYLIGERARIVMEDRDGTFLIAGWGLVQFNPASGAFTRLLPEPGYPDAGSVGELDARVNGILAIHIDREGVIWIGTEHGLLRFDRQSGRFRRFIPRPVGTWFDVSVIAAIHEDRRGTLWIGTRGGLYSFDRKF